MLVPLAALILSSIAAMALAADSVRSRKPALAGVHFEVAPKRAVILIAATGFTGIETHTHTA